MSRRPLCSRRTHRRRSPLAWSPSPRSARAGRAAQLDRLLAQLQIESLELPTGAGRRLGELRATTDLRMPDCCVLYTAEQRDAAVATFDDNLAARAVDLGLTVVTNQL